MSHRGIIDTNLKVLQGALQSTGVVCRRREISIHVSTIGSRGSRDANAKASSLHQPRKRVTVWFLAAWPPCSLAGWGWTSFVVGKRSRHCQSARQRPFSDTLLSAGVSCLCEEADQFTYRYPSSAVWPMNKGGHARFPMMPGAHRPTLAFNHNCRLTAGL